MNDKDKNYKFIPLIHNYCDRWCEHCRFIMRCRVGVEEIDRLSRQDTASDDVFESVADNVKSALEMLEKFAAENGIDLNALRKEIEDVDVPAPVFTPNQNQLKQWGQQYSLLGRSWFEQNESMLERKEHELNQALEIGINGITERATQLVNAMEVIRWFLFFISVKINRALHGMSNDWYTEEDTDPVQNDANGSAKVALDAIERSLIAWEVLREHFPENTNELIDIFVLLGRMRKRIKLLFPYVEDFVRPGFDEPELYAK